MRYIQGMMAISVVFVFGAVAWPARQAAQAPAMAASADSSGVAGSSIEPADKESESAPGNPVPAGREACWKQAGISKSVIEQRKSIVSRSKEQMRGIESDSTLTAAQQKQQMRQIRMNTRQEVGKLMTPDQQEALRQCRRNREASTMGSAPQDTGRASGASSTSGASGSSDATSRPK